MEPERVARLVKQNDNDAYRALFEAYYKRTYAVAYNILRHREVAEDITQDAFIKAFQSLHQLHDGTKFGAWLAVIASNLARNYLKREKRIYLTDEETFMPGESETDYTEEAALRHLETERVIRAIKTLPPEQYQVVVLQYYYELKIDEIAAMLELSPGTIKSRLFRARQRLAAELEPDQGSACLINEGGGNEKCPEEQT